MLNCIKIRYTSHKVLYLYWKLKEIVKFFEVNVSGVSKQNFAN